MDKAVALARHIDHGQERKLLLSLKIFRCLLKKTVGTVAFTQDGKIYKTREEPPWEQRIDGPASSPVH